MKIGTVETMIVQYWVSCRYNAVSPVSVEDVTVPVVAASEAVIRISRRTSWSGNLLRVRRSSR